MRQSLLSGNRVAFFGGSFDPPHLGHLAVARAARAVLGLDSVLFAPVGAQPLKPQGSSAGFEDRLAMTRLAIAGDPSFALSLADAPKPGGAPNYTLETLLELRAQLPAGGRLFCLMGADAFLGFRRWHRAAEIPFIAALIVASRPGEQLDELQPALPEGLTIEPLPNPDQTRPDPDQLPQAGEEHVDLKGHGFSRAANASMTAGALAPEGSFSGDSPAGLSSLSTGKPELRTYVLRNAAGDRVPFYLLPGLEIEIRASQIREHLSAGSGSHSQGQALLSDSVSGYILSHGLYR